MCVCAVNKMCGCFIRAGVCSAGVERENVATEVFFCISTNFLSMNEVSAFIFNVPHP